MSTCNVIPTTISCASFANSWTCLHDCNHCCYRQRQWIVTPDHVTATSETIEDDTKDEQTSVRRVLTENNAKKGNSKYVHVPHRDKPPQVVAKRNARERRRVQAVNNAFSRLRKAVPLENNRGKRVSKVKTLQNAIKYIQKLQELLEWHGMYEEYISDGYYIRSDNDFFEEAFEEDF